MLTMNQAGALINSATLIIILSFVFCVIYMVLSHIFKIKAIKSGSIESEKFLALRKQLVTGLGILLVCFFMALMFTNFLQNWNSSGSFDILISEHPLGRRNIINEAINSVRLLVIFTFVGIGVRLVLKFHEQITRLKSSDKQVANHNIDYPDNSNKQS